jgi:hypothetical protein
VREWRCLEEGRGMGVRLYGGRNDGALSTEVQRLAGVFDGILTSLFIFFHRLRERLSLL